MLELEKALPEDDSLCEKINLPRVMRRKYLGSILAFLSAEKSCRQNSRKLNIVQLIWQIKLDIHSIKF